MSFVELEGVREALNSDEAKIVLVSLMTNAPPSDAEGLQRRPVDSKVGVVICGRESGIQKQNVRPPIAGAGYLDEVVPSPGYMERPP